MMVRLLTILLALGLAIIAGLLVVNAQSGIPDDIANYRTWTKMNATPITDLSNPRAGPKNTFITLSHDELRDIIGPGGVGRKPFPDGTTIVRETLDPDARFLRVLFVMRKDSKAAGQTKGWVFSGFSRTAADQPFQPTQIEDPVARCLNCHLQVKASDFVFTPYTNRSDLLPARAPVAPARVEAFNYQFGPQVLRVKVGSTVFWENHDSVPHDVKAADKSFESGNLPNLGLYSFTFEKPGEVEYFCGLHLEMRGRIIIEQ
ncbi:MAG: cytochrome P460 family protein [Candidatus Tectomicrobia bacterium]|nr:cytochrome P460 family protein [Candidatus Tectomicrobia bacterium]